MLSQFREVRNPSAYDCTSAGVPDFLFRSHIFEKSRTLELMSALNVRVPDFFGDTTNLVTKFKRFGTSRIVTLLFYCHQNLEMHSTLFLR